MSAIGKTNTKSSVSHNYLCGSKLIYSNNSSLHSLKLSVACALVCLLFCYYFFWLPLNIFNNEFDVRQTHLNKFGAFFSRLFHLLCVWQQYHSFSSENAQFCIVCVLCMSNHMFIACCEHTLGASNSNIWFSFGACACVCLRVLMFCYYTLSCWIRIVALGSLLLYYVIGIHANVSDKKRERESDRLKKATRTQTHMSFY